MNIRRLPAARTLTVVLWAIVAALAGLWVGTHYWPLPSLPSLPSLPQARTHDEVTLSILRSEALAFLVTRRTVTQVVIEHEESNWLGEWRGALWAVVDFRYGVDLQKLTEADIRQEGNVATVHLPEPALLDFGIRPGSIGMLTKSTASAKIEDMLHDGHRKELERRMQSRAIEFAREQGLMPSRQQIVRQLNDAVALLRGRTGVEIRFE